MINKENYAAPATEVLELTLGNTILFGSPTRESTDDIYDGGYENW